MAVRCLRQVFLVLLVVVLPAVFGSVSKTELLALYDLYGSTNGMDWTDNDNWMKGDPCEDNWIGVTCDSTGSTVTQL